MSHDIEHLLAAAADDSDQPLTTDVGELVERGRRSVRRRRVAVLASTAVVVAAAVGAVSAWPSQRADPAPAARTPGSVVTIDVASGRIIQPAPPVSPLTDDDILLRCARVDILAAAWDKAGPIDTTWRVALKTGQDERFYAVLLSPDRTVGAGCEQEGGGHVSLMRHDLENRGGTEPLPLWTNQGRGPADLARVVADTPDGKYLRLGLVGRDGFFTFGQGGFAPDAPTASVRGYDDGGRLVLQRRLVLPAS
ncbi:hypothetical protein ACFV9C_12435 [Kribbella sp. NPDC059898]|uniref:hypothetical protein n=1 Tax=Kribbella sp. NPDC059898 TaxID=3346995 RepID=UPI0036623467